MTFDAGDGKEVDGPRHFSEVRDDRVHQEQLQVNPVSDKISAGSMGIAVDQVFLFDGTELVESVLGDVTEAHVFVGLDAGSVEVLDLVLEHLIEEGNVLVGSSGSDRCCVLKVFLQPHFKGRDLKNRIVSDLLFKVSIILGITGFRQSETSRISTELINDVTESEEVAVLLGHLLSFHEHIAMGVKEKKNSLLENENVEF